MQNPVTRRFAARLIAVGRLPPFFPTIRRTDLPKAVFILGTLVLAILPFAASGQQGLSELSDVALPAPAVWSLSGAGWAIHPENDPARVAEDWATADLDAAGWTAARVPGNIQADLEAAHQLTPLWYGAGDPRMAEVACKDWWYRKDVAVPASFVGRRLTLVFDGVDHECEVFLNGRKLGRNAGMYKRFWFDVSKAVRPGQVNRLAVRIARMPEDLRAAVLSADAPGGPNVGNASNAVRNRLKELKSPTNSGYDWAVAVYTLGIWKAVRLEATGPVRLDWVGAHSTLTDNYSKATIRVRLDLDSLAGLPVKIALSAVHEKSRAQTTVTANLAGGTNHFEVALSLNKPALWWPAGQGGHPLYELLVEVRRADTGTLLDRRMTRFGIREIRWEQTPGTPGNFINPLKLVVNGRPIRQMGSNLLPPDSLFGRMDERGPRLMELAGASGINCLRLWGGGVILSETLYDRADELGILLLQEFPLANCSPEIDSVFLANLDATAVNIVKQVRNHPSIVEWSGGNEMPWQNGSDHPALRILEKAVREHDDRFLRATEPAQGSGPHGSYTYVYHTEPAGYLSWLGAGSQNLYRRYDTSVEMRISEFGTHSPANMEVWQRTIPPASQWPLADYNDPVLIRKNVFWGAVLKENWLHKEITERLFGPLAGLEQLIQAGQFLGAEGLRYAMDALRRKGPALGGGFMSWNYNEPWPNGAGSYMVDYDGRPLMNYDFVAQALTPVSLSLKYASLLYDPATGVSAQLFLASDAPRTVRKLRWHWQARDRRGKVFSRGSGVTDSIEPQGVIPLDSVTLRPPPETVLGPVFIELGLDDAKGRTLVERLHVFGATALQAPLAGLLAKGLRDEFEICPPADAAGVDLPRVVFAGGLAARPVNRTTIEIAARPVRLEGKQEVLDLMVRNTGPMTALFCEPHPLIEYRTDLFIDNNHCFIPPGESRTLTIRASRQPKGELSLAQTGWRISSWNADERVVEPAPSVLLALGRRDEMCREFAGYGQPPSLPREGTEELNGRRPDPSRLPYLLDGQRQVRFHFDATQDQVRPPARLRIHLSDIDSAADPMLQVVVNQRRYQTTLPRGLGLQKDQPYHLAFPSTVTFDLPPGLLKPGKNSVEVGLTHSSWVTWDAMDLVTR